MLFGIGYIAKLVFFMSNDTIKSAILGKSKVTVGRFTYGLENLSIREWGEGAALEIGGFCSIAPATIVLGGNHRTDWITTFPFGHIYQDELGFEGLTGHPTTNGDVVIGNDVWIGIGVNILSGIVVGDGAVLSAYSNVVKDVGPYEIVAGNPGKVLRRRFDDEVIELLLRLRWWSLPLEKIRKIGWELCQEPDPLMLREMIAKYRPT